MVVVPSTRQISLLVYLHSIRYQGLRSDYCNYHSFILSGQATFGTIIACGL